MLFDPRWKIEKADPYALSTLIAWLEKQPAGARYNYSDCTGRCLLGLYLLAHLVSWSDGSYGALCDRTDWGYNIAAKGPWTFGAALERARAVAA